MKFKSLLVLPKTPEKLAPLLEMANNLWSFWNPAANDLFSELHPDLWVECRMSPLRLLNNIPQEILLKYSEDQNYLNRMNDLYNAFKNYLNKPSWFQGKYGNRDKKTVAFFSLEYGLHDTFPIYQGGLGVLAGDILKSASDLGVPMIGIGLLYRQGQYRQEINEEGMQHERYVEAEWSNLPISLEKDEKGKTLIMDIEMFGGVVYFQIWKLQVGRVPLYLFDTDIPQNDPNLRTITQKLYVADRPTRLRQEILIGMGGVKAIKALGLNPSVFHINEGHSALLILQRVINLVDDEKISFEEAVEVVRASNVFTLHTPIAAGNERFDIELVRKAIPHVREKRGWSWNMLSKLGLGLSDHAEKEFDLSGFAIALSSVNLGVSKLHGAVSREMWSHIYTTLPKKEIPIGSITNGVHCATWMSRELLTVLGVSEKNLEEISWNKVEKVPDEKIWQIQNLNKGKLVEEVRRLVNQQLTRRQANAIQLQKMSKILNPAALTIGFARRFAPYKRGDLILRDINRLEKILKNPGKPVQLIFAGRSHPADQAGKEIIKKIHQGSLKDNLYDSIIFLEDYGMAMAKYLVTGVDMWLNNPRRPLEASGTSGMKAAMNGAINLSILDGWWDEAYTPELGWAIGARETYKSEEEQDNAESEILYSLLEDEIVPTYYDRDAFGIPRKWVNLMKKSIQVVGENFNSDRMVRDYTKYYVESAEKNFNLLTADNFKNAKELAQWRNKMVSSWPQVNIIEVSLINQNTIHSGEEAEFLCKIQSEKLGPQDIRCELFYGFVAGEIRVSETESIPMEFLEKKGDQLLFKVKFKLKKAGALGFTARIFPKNSLISGELVSNMIKWEP